MAPAKVVGLAAALTSAATYEYGLKPTPSSPAPVSGPNAKTVPPLVAGTVKFPPSTSSTYRNACRTESGIVEMLQVAVEPSAEKLNGAE